MLKNNIRFSWFLLCFISNFSWGQAPTVCKVKDQEIAGIYIGDCLNGLAHGSGKAQGRISYEGEFSQGYKNGKGILVWETGARYEGDFLNDRITGKGIVVWKDGSRYEGNFFEDNHHGLGILIREGIEYSGSFEQGRMSGKFKVKYRDGAKYEGTLLNFRREGEGTLLIPKNDKVIQQLGNNALIRGEYLVLSGKWKNDKLIESNSNKMVADELLAQIGEKNGFNMDEIRNYCSFVKLLSHHNGAKNEDEYFNKLSSIYASNSNAVNDFDKRRKKGEFLTWIRKCTKEAKMPRQGFYTNAIITYKKYDFNKRILELSVNIKPNWHYIPQEVIEGWYQELSQLGFGAVTYHKTLLIANSAHPYLLRNGDYVDDWHFGVYIPVSEDVAEKFSKETKNQKSPAIVKIKLDGIGLTSFNEVLPAVFNVSIANISAVDTAGQKILSYDFELPRVKRKLSN